MRRLIVSGAMVASLIGLLAGCGVVGGAASVAGTAVSVAGKAVETVADVVTAPIQ